jgi:nucleotide-binding universal stress UspA family protein
MLNKILVPTDFSDCATRASKVAIEIAKQSGADIHFLHITSIPIDWIQLNSDQDNWYPDVTHDVNQKKHNLQELVKLAQLEAIDAKSYLGYNEGFQDILNYIDNQDISLVVMGSHGAGGIKEFFLGSNAQKIVRQSPVPVLILKSETSLDSFGDIIFVSDFEEENIRPFQNLVDFAEAIKARIHVVFINTPTFFMDSWEIDDKMEPFIRMAGDSLGRTDVIDSYVFEDGLDKYCDEFDSVLVAMATHGRKGLSRVFYGSLTEKIVNHCNRPLLSLKIPREEARKKTLQQFI